MNIELTVRPEPDRSTVSAIAAANPFSPFVTPAYAAAQRAQGAKPCAFLLNAGDEMLAGALGFISGGTHVRYLNIPSWPSTRHSATINEGIVEFCRRENIAFLEIDNFATVTEERLAAPSIDAEVAERAEFYICLRESPHPAGWSTNHRRNLRKAEKAGLAVSVSSNPEDVATHLSMQQSSARRRIERGESIALATSPSPLASLIEEGAGVLFHAKHGEETLATALILISKSAGYYHSAGSSPRGMREGASTLLIEGISRYLASEGCVEFNLGGAGRSASGLRRFKLGFGTYERPLYRFSCRTASRSSILVRRVLQKLSRGKPRSAR